VTRSGALGTSNWNRIALTYDTTTLTQYFNGSSVGTPLATSGNGTGPISDRFGIGGTGHGFQHASIYADEVYILNTALTANWLLTDYNNQSSPSTFYSVGNEVGGSTNVTVNPSAQVATFSVPSRSINVGVRQTPAAQVATFSVPSYTVAFPKTVTPSAQALTFTIPAYVITSDGNIIILPSAQALTFSIPAYSVSVGLRVTPAVQALTLSIPTPTIVVESNVTIQPAVQVLTFSLPALSRVGGIWKKRARATDATWSRRSVNDD
jgi:hypothetical protein